VLIVVGVALTYFGSYLGTSLITFGASLLIGVSSSS